ncbi:MAG: cysteine desulfurase [Oscillospiraceae bacterium]|nr:cysteine desulfurase [Oscillospiraceae bacterium]
MIYLDYSANTPVAVPVLERFVQIERRFIGNPNSHHCAGNEARQEMDSVTQSIAARLGIEASEIIYTSGASEANNLAIKGIARASRHAGKHIISTALEHQSASGCLTALQEQGYEIDLVDINRDGTVSLDHLEELMRKDTILVAVCAVDSELGVSQPIHQIAELVKKYPQCRLHVDATQAVGKTNIIFEGVDTLSISPHKFYGLNGCGILYKRKDLVIEPLIHGGVSTTIYRSGTPALALAAATDTALELALTNQSENVNTVQRSNTYLRNVLSAYPKVRFNSPENAIPHILNLSVTGVRGSDFQKALDKHGVCVSVKSACSVENTPSRAVFAVSRDRKNALSSWRISLSHLTTQTELEEFIKIFDLCYKELCK